MRTRSRRDVSSPGGAADRRSIGTIVLAVVATLFVAISIPVVVRGAPLADDFTNCLMPQRIGLLPTLAASIDRLGALRKAHLLEIVLTTETCQHLPFGVAIAVPLALTLAVAFLLRGLLRDLGVPSPWPEVGGALWLLQPLGTEGALWPAALHIPLGLALALSALRLHRSGRHIWASLAAVGACLSVEQVVLALPLAVWVTVPADRRRVALTSTTAVSLLTLVAIVAWPGDDPRLRVSVAERISSAIEDPTFPFAFAAVGLGAHSIPLAVVWAFPASVVALALGATLGFGFPVRPSHDRGSSGWRAARARLGTGILLIALVDAPVVLSVPHQGSPRLFAPTWLVISAILATLAPSVACGRCRLWTGLAGLIAGGALLSQTLSVSVRLDTASFVRSASERIGTEVADGSVVGLCGITRTVVQPAPRGAFAVHDLVYDWAAHDAVEYYTGTRVRFLLAGELWNDSVCPQPDEVDRVFSFPDLVTAWRRDG